jgi:hypothetical protein
MRVMIALLVAVAACKSGSKKDAPAANAGSWIQNVKAWGERACKCNADRQCVKPIRDEWEAVKYQYRDAADTFAPADRKAYDAALLYFRQCGDAAGVTIWVN